MKKQLASIESKSSCSRFVNDGKLWRNRRTKRSAGAGAGEKTNLNQSKASGFLTGLFDSQPAPQNLTVPQRSTDFISSTSCYPSKWRIAGARTCAHLRKYEQ